MIFLRKMKKHFTRLNFYAIIKNVDAPPSVLGISPLMGVHSLSLSAKGFDENILYKGG